MPQSFTTIIVDMPKCVKLLIEQFELQLCAMWPDKKQKNSKFKTVHMHSLLKSLSRQAYLPRGKSLVESLDTTFLPDWQPPLVFVWFTSKFHEH